MTNLNSDLISNLLNDVITLPDDVIIIDFLNLELEERGKKGEKEVNLEDRLSFLLLLLLSSPYPYPPALSSSWLILLPRSHGFSPSPPAAAGGGGGGV